MPVPMGALRMLSSQPHVGIWTTSFMSTDKIVGPARIAAAASGKPLLSANCKAVLPALFF